MIPAFDPRPNPFGPPPVFIGGFGPRMMEVAAEVADGLIAHPCNTRRSLLENTLPALERGLARSGRRREQLEVVCATLVVTADDELEFERVKTAARKQLAFYGSTPAYRSTLEVHGWGNLHIELNRLSKQGRWEDMAGCISDEILEEIAVVGPRHEIADRLRTRLRGIADAVSLTHNRAPDPDHRRTSWPISRGTRVRGHRTGSPKAANRSICGASHGSLGWGVRVRIGVGGR
jgi:probable F420-dependent oxidoreductase